jgi:hypothetical protein
MNADKTVTANYGLSQKYQIISAIPIAPKVKSGGSFNLDVYYNTSDSNEKLSGLGLRIHYDSSKLTFNGFSNVLATSKIAQDSSPVIDNGNLDGDALTDNYLQVAWADVSALWPNTALPVRLYTINFSVKNDLSEGTISNIRFSAADTAIGYILQAAVVPFEVQSCTLDIDGNGQAKPLSDGLLIIRYLFGFRGETLINGAIGDGATLKNATEIENYLAITISCLDIDGNGQAKPLSDGLLIIRYLFGFRGETLINGAIGDGATRKSAPEIEGYLQSLMP